MVNRISMLLLSGVIGISLAGCAASSPTLRAQSPGGGECADGCNTHGGNCHGGACEGGVCYGDGGAAYGGYGYGHGAQAGAGGYGSAAHGSAACSCRGAGCDRCLNLPFHPVHRNFYTYQVPKNLKYPQSQTPAAVYQYPYYTTRGPTDFFMK